MAPLARPLEREAGGAKVIHIVGNRIQVVWVYAGPVTTKVIQVEPLGDRANHDFVGVTVGFPFLLLIPSSGVELAVPAT